MNIVDPILFHAKNNPGAIAVCTPGVQPESITYGDLERLINNITRMAVMADLARGQVVAIFLTNKIFEVALTLALMRLGIATASLRSPSMPRETQVDAVIAEKPLPFDGTNRVIVADATWKQLHDRPLADSRLYQTAEQDICRLILTSGTTGEPKAVALTNKDLIDRIPRFDYVMGSHLPHCRRLYSDLGLPSATGFRMTLYMLWKGGTIFLFGADSAAMVQAFDLFKVGGMLTAPNGLAQYLQFYELPGAPACNFDFIICLGAQMSAFLANRVRAHMCPNLYSVYGATEVSTIAAAPSIRLMNVEGAVGYTAPDIVVEIVNRSGAVLPNGREGFVRVKSSLNVRGYFGELSPSDAFRDGAFYPGDIGRLSEDGLLVIRGRESNVINLGGDKLNPEMVEQTLMGSGQVAEAGVFSVPNALGVQELWAAVVAAQPLQWTALQNACAQKLGKHAVPSHFIQVAALPKTAAGKLDRAALSMLAKRG